ncbi:MAG: hypothetical protein AAF479_01950 [Pseudomonadota bacterium]
MSDKVSFYKGTPLDSQRFVAVASFDALEHPAEPSGVAVLLSFALGTGWSVSRHSDGARVADVTALDHPGETLRSGLALTEDGAILSFDPGAPDAQVEGLAGITTVAFAQSNSELFIIGNTGHFYRDQGDLQFGLVTDRHIVPPPTWEASRAERRAYFRTQTYFMNAESDPDGRIAMTEIGKLMVLERELSLTEYLHPRILVGVTYDRGSGQFWFCGHSPKPVVAREVSPGTFETVYEGSPGAHVFTDLAVYQGEIYLADTDLAAGGLYVLTPEEGADFEFVPADLPEAFGVLPVWKVEVQDGVLWALRTKDLLRYDGSDWQRFPIPDVRQP